MPEHKLKTWPPCFEAITATKKRFEIRKNDRGFKAGDTLMLYEFDPEKGNLIEAKGYTGRKQKCLVLSVWPDLPGCKPGYCIMDILIITEIETEAEKQNGS